MSEVTYPKWLVPVGIVALIWNLLGCAAYLADAMLTPEQIAQMNEAQQAFYANRPFWVVGSTAVAVWLGALGSLFLALRRSWALPVLVVSLIGILIQDVYLFGMSNAVEVEGVAVPAVQGTVLVVGVLLVWVAVTAQRKHWFRSMTQPDEA